MMGWRQWVAADGWNGLIASRVCLSWGRDGGRAWGTVVQSSSKQTAYSGLHYDFWTLRSLFVEMRFLQRRLDRRRTAVVQGGQWRWNPVFLSSFSKTFSGKQQEFSHEPQASSGQGEKDQQASEGNLEYFCLKMFQFSERLLWEIGYGRWSSSFCYHSREFKWWRSEKMVINTVDMTR